MSEGGPVTALGSWVRMVMRVRIWLAEHFRLSEAQVMLLWAVPIGLLGAWASIVFKGAAELLHGLGTGQGGGYVDSFRHMAPWRRLVVPLFGGLLAGLALYYGNRVKRAKSTTDYMEAVVVGDGRLSLKESLVKCLSSLFSVASGASIGREGPIVLLSSLVASVCGRVVKFSLVKQRQIVACGAAAGIASAYNAPISGAFFVAEIVLGSMAMEFFGPMVVSSVVAVLVVHAHEGAAALYAAPVFHLESSLELIPCLFLGIACGLATPMYLSFLRHSERLFTLTRLPVWLRLALGGVLVGVLAWHRPEVVGNGRSLIFDILNDPYSWQLLALILVCKLLATGATFGSGAVGGVFTITLFTGAATGFLFGTVVGALFPGLEMSPPAFALVGMGAFLAAATGAPVMAIIMIFELTTNYQILLPVILSGVLSYQIARSLSRSSLYARALNRKGQSAVNQFLAGVKAGDLVVRDAEAVEADTGFGKIVRTFLHSTHEYLHVVRKGRFLGTISLHDIKPYLDQPELESVLIAEDVMREESSWLRPEQTLGEALHVFGNSRSESLPVLDRDFKGTSKN